MGCYTVAHRELTDIGVLQVCDALVRVIDSQTAHVRPGHKAPGVRRQRHPQLDLKEVRLFDTFLFLWVTFIDHEHRYGTGSWRQSGPFPHRAGGQIDLHASTVRNLFRVKRHGTGGQWELNQLASRLALPDLALDHPRRTSHSGHNLFVVPPQKLDL